jgi:hypothetical protein
MTFSRFSIPPPVTPHFEPEMEMKMVEFFLSGLVCLITRWMEHIMRPQEESQLKLLGVIHECQMQTDRADRSNTQIHSFMNESA